MVKKEIGYVLSVVGVLILALSVPPIKGAVVGVLPFLEGVSNIYFIIAGVVVIAGGVLVLRGSGGSKKEKEVPIYKGKDVVGYRRMGK